MRDIFSSVKDRFDTMTSASKILRPIPDEMLLSLLAYLEGKDNFVYLDTVRVSEENHCSYLFLEPVARLRCLSSDDPGEYLDSLQEMTEKGFYVAGWIAYEFGYMLEPVLSKLAVQNDLVVADFGVYSSPHIIDHRKSEFDLAIPDLNDGYDRSSVKDELSISAISFSQGKEEYFKNIERIKSYIETGDTYQVNYTLKLLFEYLGSDMTLYRSLRRNQSVSYGALIKNGERRIMSFSPELFFRKQGNECFVRPMKGTMHRAPDLETDKDLRGTLAADVKNRSENVMIVDLLRNDLGRLSQKGTVEVQSLFDVETYETLHQMTSSIKGVLDPGVGLDSLFRAIFPCGSVTGAPKIRTMEIIKELETAPRGVYTGGIGFFSPGGAAVFNVPIRTVVLDKTMGEMGIGSGIVYDSNPEREWDECVLKGRFLLEPEPDFQLIETMLWEPGKGYFLLDVHLERLQNSALYWDINCDIEKIRDELEAEPENFDDGDISCYRVRLLLHKDGKLEISSAPCSQPAGLVGGLPEQLFEVCIAKEKTNSENPFFYHKTTRRELYKNYYELANENGYFDVLFTNEKDEVTEGCITNVFIRRGDELITPPVSCGLLCGVLRHSLLSGKFRSFEGVSVREEILRISDLENADEIYLVNSVRGLVKVVLDKNRL